MSEFGRLLRADAQVPTAVSSSPRHAGRWTAYPAMRAVLVWVYLFTYVYVVVVNKALPKLCTTPISFAGSNA